MSAWSLKGCHRLHTQLSSPYLAVVQAEAETKINLRVFKHGSKATLYSLAALHLCRAPPPAANLARLVSKLVRSDHHHNLTLRHHPLRDNRIKPPPSNHHHQRLPRLQQPFRPRQMSRRRRRPRTPPRPTRLRTARQLRLLRPRRPAGNLPLLADQLDRE